jgi:hypothetical protein
MKLIRPIKICVNGTYNKVLYVNICDNFIIQNGLKQVDALIPLPLNFAL